MHFQFILMNSPNETKSTFSKLCRFFFQNYSVITFYKRLKFTVDYFQLKRNALFSHLNNLKDRLSLQSCQKIFDALHYLLDDIFVGLG